MSQRWTRNQSQKRLLPIIRIEQMGEQLPAAIVVTRSSEEEKNNILSACVMLTLCNALFVFILRPNQMS